MMSDPGWMSPGPRSRARSRASRAALAREGLKPGERVALCLRNRVEWVCFDQAAASLGLVTVPLYFDDRPDNMAFCLNDAGCKLLLLENAALWPALRAQTKSLARVVCLERVAAADPRLTCLTDWLPAQGDELVRASARADELATLVYTSGTTGRPKGVMLSHRNILTNVAASLKAIPVYPSDRFLSFLPLSHMFERTCGYYLGMQAGAQTVYARSISLLAEDLRTQRPTVLIAVPRIFERIHARMQEGLLPGSFKRRLFESAVDIGWKRFNRRAALHERFCGRCSSCWWQTSSSAGSAGACGLSSSAAPRSRPSTRACSWGSGCRSSRVTA